MPLKEILNGNPDHATRYPGADLPVPCSPVIHSCRIVTSDKSNPSSWWVNANKRKQKQSTV